MERNNISRRHFSLFRTFDFLPNFKISRFRLPPKLQQVSTVIYKTFLRPILFDDRRVEIIQMGSFLIFNPAL